MISITKMVTGEATVSEKITYEGDRSHIPRKLVELSKSLRPIVVWNITKACNLRCIHCYASAESHSAGELTTEECKTVIDDLAEMKVPLILFSGGEPLLRRDVFELASYAASKGLKCALSTNGTLITPKIAEKIKEAGFVYVGVSIDGMPETNDRFRGVKGAFKKAFEGLINARDVGLLTGIRFTVTKFNIRDIPAVIDLLAENDVPRFCLYHLVPSGRADFSYDISLKERRELMDWLFNKAIELHDEGCKTEILTVDNPCDGVYICLKLKEIDEELAFKAFEFLKYRGGDRSGSQLANIDMFGDVHPNQFWWDHTCGNVRKEKFSDIWLNPKDELLIKLRNKQKYLRGRCRRCAYKDVCGGFRLRALRAGDLWGDDPDCYLSDDEIKHNVFL